MADRCFAHYLGRFRRRCLLSGTRPRVACGRAVVRCARLHETVVSNSIRSKCCYMTLLNSWALPSSLAFLAQNKSEMCNGACVLFYVRGWSLSTFRAFFDDCLPLGVDRAGTTLNLVHVALAQPQRAVGSNWYVISLSKTMVRLWSTIKDSSTALVVRVAYRLHAPPHATTRCLDQIPRSVT